MACGRGQARNHDAETVGTTAGTECERMPIAVTCSGCGKPVRGRPEMADRKAKCLACGSEILPRARGDDAAAESARRTTINESVNPLDRDAPLTEMGILKESPRSSRHMDDRRPSVPLHSQVSSSAPSYSAGGASDEGYAGPSGEAAEILRELRDAGGGTAIEEMLEALRKEGHYQEAGELRKWLDGQASAAYHGSVGSTAPTAFERRFLFPVANIVVATLAFLSDHLLWAAVLAAVLILLLGWLLLF